MGKPTRTPVSLTADERSLIEAAMSSLGFRTMSEFMRIATLEKAAKAAGK
jgi:uncharacterized protein (DUF1778 family)